MPTTLPVSVIVLTFNEEANIEACLCSVADWAGEVIVVDSGSTDRTLAIARRYTSRVEQHPFENYARQRNWAQDNLNLAHEWVFHIDADERVTPELAQSLHAFFAAGSYKTIAGALVARRTVFMGRAILHGGHYPVFHVRLFRRDRGRCENRLYDQHFLVDGLTCRLAGDLIDVITSDLTVWTTRHVRWAMLEAEEHFATVKGREQVRAQLTGTPIERRRWLRSSLYGRAPLFLRALAYFCVRYVLRMGFRDGIEGLIFHVLQGLWYRFYIDAKIYEMQHNARLGPLGRASYSRQVQ